MAIRKLSLDIETFSDVDLKKCGVYKYAESPNFEILLLGVSADGGEVRVYDLAGGETVPEEIVAALADDSVVKWAYNASFERVCLSVWLRKNYPEYFSSYSIWEDTVGDYLDPASWRCSLVWGAYLGLPLSLEGIGAALKLDVRKMTEGKALVRYFCVPCKPTQANGGRTRNLPEHDPAKWSTFIAYNRRDVETEMAVREKLSRFPVPDFLWEEYHLSEEINDRGICVDMALVDKAIELDGRSREELSGIMRRLTSMENPNSVRQMKEWLARHGLETDSLDRKAVRELLKTAPPKLARVLELRQQLAKSSVKKYQAMRNAVCGDSRARGMYQFYGANRTGRFAGRLVQMQNLPANHMEHLEDARTLALAGDYDMLSSLYDSVPEVLSELIRTAFVPRAGFKFVVADFSAIEARVLSFLADEEWRLDAFERGEDIYCASASQMFHVPVEKHGVNGHLRQKGKQAELACIAEGQPVLTNRGLVPIEKVTKSHLLWDGEQWVQHDGVVFKGIREVITYDGLTATEDHLVWVCGQPEPVPFGLAAASGARLLQTGDVGRAINPRSPDSETVRRMEPGRGDRCVRAEEELAYHKRTARLYDIRNAGRHHRFTVSGKLVHNCGYGGSVGALKAMGALESGMKEEELKPLVDAWRASNPNIVRFWWDVDQAAKNAVKTRGADETHGIRFSYESGFLFITLPSGRRLAYVKPRIGENRFGGESITYEGIGAAKKWERLETYGPKLVENIVQAVSRDILMYAMRTLSHCFIVGHVHDELIIEASMGVSVDAVCERMGRTPPWVMGLPLRADGYETMFYRKD